MNNNAFTSIKAYSISSLDLERQIEAHFKLKYFDLVDCRDGQTYTYHATKRVMGAYGEKSQLERIIAQKNTTMTNVGLILTQLCNDGEIEEGVYLVVGK
jgi:DNA-binding transcriptional regulator LsrR (DeoR family)